MAVLDYLPGLKSGLRWLLLKPGPGPLKTWTLKSMNTEKHGINKELKICSIKTMRSVV